MSERINIAICRHVKTNGHRCGSPAIKGTALCFHHRNLHRTHRRPQSAESLMSTWQEAILDGYRTAELDPLTVARAYPKQNEFHFPPLEDAESVQLATSMLFQAIATGQIHFKRAKMLLMTLKIATVNIRAVTTAARFTPDNGPIPTRVVRTTHGHILAAPEEDEDTCDSTETPAAPHEPLTLNAAADAPDKPAIVSEAAPAISAAVEGPPVTRPAAAEPIPSPRRNSDSQSQNLHSSESHRDPTAGPAAKSRHKRRNMNDIPGSPLNRKSCDRMRATSHSIQTSSAAQQKIASFIAAPPR